MSDLSDAEVEIPDPNLELDDEDDDIWNGIVDSVWEFSDRLDICPDGGDEALYTPPNNRNHYINYLKQSRDLFLHNPSFCLGAWRTLGATGLFHLFIKNSMFHTFLVWLNNELERKGITKATMAEFKALVGLELGASLVGFNSIKDFWSGKDFEGCNVYLATLPRTRFEVIRANFQIHPPSDNPIDQYQDPLYFCRELMNHFQRQCYKVATPRGACAGDEASQGTGHKTRGSSFNKDKPDKHAFRFYCWNSHSPNYVNSIFDNNTGNLSTFSQLDRYLYLMPELRKMFNKYYGRWKTKPLEFDDPLVPRRSASALWAAQILQQTQRDPQGIRVYFNDSYYTRHLLAKIGFKLSGGKTTLCGTVKYGYIDAVNKVPVNNTISRIQGMAKGSWVLVPAIDCVEPPQFRREQARKRRRKGAPPPRPYKKKTLVIRRENLEGKTIHQVTIGSGGSKEDVNCVVSENAGFVVLMDSKPVIFYTNDLATDVPCEPTDMIVEDSSERSPKVNVKVLACVRQLATIRRWTDDSWAHRCSLLVSALIVAYNTFMNAVDIMDQYRAIKPSVENAMIKLDIATLE